MCFVFQRILKPFKNLFIFKMLTSETSPDVFSLTVVVLCCPLVFILHFHAITCFHPANAERHLRKPNLFQQDVPVHKAQSSMMTRCGGCGWSGQTQAS